MKTKKIVFIVAGVMATFVGLYPFAYSFVNRKFGLLQMKNEALLNTVAWNIIFYLHITLGGIALLMGWTQFSERLITNKLKLH